MLVGEPKGTRMIGGPKGRPQSSSDDTAERSAFLSQQLREDGTKQLREDGAYKLREG